MWRWVGRTEHHWCSVLVEKRNQLEVNEELNDCFQISTIGQQQRGTHHGNRRIELCNAHSAGWMLAVETLVSDVATVNWLHRRLSSVWVKVD